MLFGDASRFAVEAALEPGPEYGPIACGNIAGRIRVWLSGTPVGRFDEPLCVLGGPCNHLVEHAAALDSLWHPSLDNLSPEQIFDRLDWIAFGADRIRPDIDYDAPPHYSPEEERLFGRFSFLLHSSEAFDGWKSFLINPPNSDLLALVQVGDSTELLAATVPADAFRSAVADFAHWHRQRERELLPHLFT
jgi:hypothetical protein